MGYSANYTRKKDPVHQADSIDTNTEINSILLGIDAETKHIYKVIETGKNGTVTTITVNSFKTNQPLSKTLFTFDESKYKDEGYYIIRN